MLWLSLMKIAACQYDKRSSTAINIKELEQKTSELGWKNVLTIINPVYLSKDWQSVSLFRLKTSHTYHVPSLD